MVLLEYLAYSFLLQLDITSKASKHQVKVTILIYYDPKLKFRMNLDHPKT